MGRIVFIATAVVFVVVVTVLDFLSYHNDNSPHEHRSLRRILQSTEKYGPPSVFDEKSSSKQPPSDSIFDTIADEKMSSETKQHLHQEQVLANEHDIDMASPPHQKDLQTTMNQKHDELANGEKIQMQQQMEMHNNQQQEHKLQAEEELRGEMQMQQQQAQEQNLKGNEEPRQEQMQQEQNVKGNEEPRQEQMQIQQRERQEQESLQQQQESLQQQQESLRQQQESLRQQQESLQLEQKIQEPEEPRQEPMQQQQEQMMKEGEEQTSQPMIKTNWNLPEQAAKWCRPSEMNFLPYNRCDQGGTFNSINFMAGLTNGLKMMLLQVIESFEQNRCFFITEEHNHLLLRTDKSQQLDTFMGRYFEPIGLSQDDPLVKRAKADGRVNESKWQDVWDTSLKRRVHGMYYNITSLGMTNIEGTVLKRVMLERMWRLLPNVREASCTSLEETHGLSDEYLAFSVRRGDKDTEGFDFVKPEAYITAAEKVVDDFFDRKLPTIFVATDDCDIMKNFRDLRPEWNFVSECDQSKDHKGFILSEMKDWTLEQTDEHFRKFFVEIIGLAGAKYYIGVAYTNVAWWAHYMRPHRWSHLFLDTNTENALNNW